jgi:hypothetical protein
LRLPDRADLTVPDDDLNLRAANAYVVWPLAILDYVREPLEATAWSRLHNRQALVFGILASLGYVVLLALPLAVVIAVPGMSIGAVVWLYGAGLLADVAGAAALAWLAFRYRSRTLHGQLFSIPFVTPLADRLLRIEP